MENLTNATNANSGLQFFNATGVRQPKSVNESVVIAESTRSSFKLMPAVCAKLGVQDGDYVTMQMTKDENGVVTGVYIGKGKNATYVTNEDGSIALDERKRKVVAKGGEGFGALASELTTGTNVLKISVASAWDALGNTEVKKHYALSDEPVTAQLPTGNGEYLTTTLYKLEFIKNEEKVVRATKADKAEAASGETASEEAPIADGISEATVDSNPVGGSDFDNGEF